MEGTEQETRRDLAFDWLVQDMRVGIPPSVTLRMRMAASSLKTTLEVASGPTCCRQARSRLGRT